MKKKFLTGAAAIISLSLILAGCGPKKSETPVPSTEKSELTEMKATESETAGVKTIEIETTETDETEMTEMTKPETTEAIETTGETIPFSSLVSDNWVSISLVYGSFTKETTPMKLTNPEQVLSIYELFKNTELVPDNEVYNSSLCNLIVQTPDSEITITVINSNCISINGQNYTAPVNLSQQNLADLMANLGLSELPANIPNTPTPSVETSAASNDSGLPAETVPAESAAVSNSSNSAVEFSSIIPNDWNSIALSGFNIPAYAGNPVITDAAQINQIYRIFESIHLTESAGQYETSLGTLNITTSTGNLLIKVLTASVISINDVVYTTDTDFTQYSALLLNYLG